MPSGLKNCKIIYRVSGPQKKMLKLTDNAIERLTQIAKDHGRRYCRLGVKGGGCAGFEYEWSTCNEEEKGDVVLKDILVVNRDYELYLLGTTLDLSLIHI